VTKFLGGVGHGSRTKWYNFGGDPDHASDPGVQSPKSGSSRSAEVCAVWAYLSCIVWVNLLMLFFQYVIVNFFNVSLSIHWHVYTDEGKRCVARNHRSVLVCDQLIRLLTSANACELPYSAFWSVAILGSSHHVCEKVMMCFFILLVEWQEEHLIHRKTSAIYHHGQRFCYGTSGRKTEGGGGLSHVYLADGHWCEGR